MQKKFAYFDGDNIGNSIKNLLDSHRSQEATHLSESIKLAVFQIEQLVSSTNDVELIIAGGDDILIEYDPDKVPTRFLDDIKNVFTRYTGLSMSCGVGDNLEQTMSSLIDAKKLNKGSLKSDNSEFHLSNIYNKPTKLYIFTTSDLADPYINVIGHCIAHYNINQIILIGITEDRGKSESKSNSLLNLKENIRNQLDKLIHGKYRSWNREKKEYNDLDILLESTDCRRYAKIKSYNLDIQVIIYNELEKEISKLLNSTDSFGYIFDVTAVLKSHLVDVYTILRLKNVSTIYSFELSLNKRTYDYTELIHNLTHQKTYEYTCLAESPVTRGRIVVNEDVIISEATFNHQTSLIKSLEKNRDNLEEVIATNFARWWLIISYSLIGIPLVGWIIWVVSKPGGWNQIEPYTYVFSIAWLLVVYITQSLFAGKLPPLNPHELFRFVKQLKIKQLKRRRLEK